jgi:hypothetical protein
MGEQRSNGNTDELKSLIAGTNSESEPVDFNEHVDKCMSMVIHHPEIAEIVSLIKKIHRERQ